MGTALRAKVVQRGILLREHDGRREALLMRNPDGTWELPGGKIEHGDTASESLEREIREETGLVVTSAEPVETAVRRVKKRKNRGKFGVVYRCEFEDGAVDISDEHVDFAWASEERVVEANLKQVDEYRSLRRVLSEEDGRAVPTGVDAQTAEGGEQ
jgi:8-oxo-dGTP diphosphatase